MSENKQKYNVIGKSVPRIDGYDKVTGKANLKVVPELNTNNETLKEQNMKLYLRVGQPTDTSKTGAESDKGNDEEMSYEDLFNEEGELI